MNSHLFFSSPFLSLVCFLLAIFVKIQSSSSNPNYLYESCKIPFQCGRITAGYPFLGGPQRSVDCGHPELKLSCEDEGHLATMTINEVKYRVLEIKLKDETLRIARMDYFEPEGICSLAFPNITIDSELFDYSYGYENVTFLYDCPPSLATLLLQDVPCINITGTVEHKNWSMKEKDDDRGSMCDASVFFPVPKNSLNWKAIIEDHLLLRQFLDQGFELNRKLSCENCTNSKGSCGWDRGTNETICFCPNLQHCKIVNY